MRTLATLLLVAVAWPGIAAAGELSFAWMVPAAAHTAGVGGTFWRTDVSLHNPHSYELPVVVQLLPSEQSNWQADAVDVTLEPYETVNLWDALGSDLFDWSGTGAVIAYTDPTWACDPPEECDFLTYSRTYTVDPGDAAGELGQGIPAIASYDGLDWSGYGYAAGILNDGGSFRCNVGVASWTADWTTVLVDVQDAAGNIIDTQELDVPPFGHVQRRLRTAVTGGSLVFYLASGPDDALVFPYASMVNQRTGDPSWVPAIPSVVGVSIAAAQSAAGPGRLALPNASVLGVTVRRGAVRGRAAGAVLR